MLNAISWGAPFVLYWEMYNNEVDGNRHTGFWLIDDRGNPWPFYDTHREALWEGKQWVSGYMEEFGHLPPQQEYLDRLEEFLMN